LGFLLVGVHPHTHSGRGPPPTIKLGEATRKCRS
jgi:hypothetical protein